MEAVARDLQARAEASGIAIEVRAGPSRTVVADPDRLRQMLAAMADNAIRHTPAGGRVSMSTEATGSGWTRLAVVDSGTGIAAEDLPHVFERFYQADAARDRSTDTSGLGLSIVRALAEAHGGTVRATNEPGGGARFELDLPGA